jgi:hypothetical protein
VTLYFSIEDKAVSSSNFSRMIDVAPEAKNPVLKFKGAAW